MRQCLYKNEKAINREWVKGLRKREGRDRQIAKEKKREHKTEEKRESEGKRIKEIEQERKGEKERERERDRDNEKREREREKRARKRNVEKMKLRGRGKKLRDARQKKWSSLKEKTRKSIERSIVEKLEKKEKKRMV